MDPSVSHALIIGGIVLLVLAVFVTILAGQHDIEAKKHREDLGYTWPNIQPRPGTRGYIEIHVCTNEDCGARGDHWHHMFMFSEPCKFCGHTRSYDESAKWNPRLLCWETAEEVKERKSIPEPTPDPPIPTPEPPPEPDPLFDFGDRP